MIAVSEKAVTEIKRIIAEQGVEKVCLRIRVVGGGCSGFQTKLDLDEVWDEAKDDVIEQDGIKVVVDKRSLIYLEGASVDYHEDLNKRGFVINNPMATGRCGCGSSFSM